MIFFFFNFFTVYLRWGRKICYLLQISGGSEVLGGLCDGLWQGLKGNEWEVRVGRSWSLDKRASHWQRGPDGDLPALSCSGAPRDPHLQPSPQGGARPGGGPLCPPHLHPPAEIPCSGSNSTAYCPGTGALKPGILTCFQMGGVEGGVGGRGLVISCEMEEKAQGVSLKSQNP